MICGQLVEVVCDQLVELMWATSMRPTGVDYRTGRNGVTKWPKWCGQLAEMM